MEKDALQDKLNEAMMQSQKVTMQMGEMAQDLRAGLRERESLNMEKQHLTKEINMLNQKLTIEREQSVKSRYELRKSRDEVKEYHRFLKRTARELESSIEEMKILSSKLPNVQIDLMAKSRFFLKVLKFLKVRSKKGGTSNVNMSSLGKRNPRPFRSSSFSVHNRSPGSNTTYGITTDDGGDIGGANIPRHLTPNHNNRPELPKRARSAYSSTLNNNSWDARSRGSSPMTRDRTGSVVSNLSDLSSYTDWKVQSDHLFQDRDRADRIPVPPMDSRKNRYHKVHTDGLKLFFGPNTGSEVLSFLRTNQIVFVCDETADFLKISEPRVGWVMKTQTPGEQSLKVVFEEILVASECVSVCETIGGSEIRRLKSGERFLSSEKQGSWIFAFYPLRGWIESESGIYKIQRSRFLDITEMFRDYSRIDLSDRSSEARRRKFSTQSSQSAHPDYNNFSGSNFGGTLQYGDPLQRSPSMSSISSFNSNTGGSAMLTQNRPHNSSRHSSPISPIRIDLSRNGVATFLQIYSNGNRWNHETSKIDGLTTLYYFHYQSKSFHVEVNGVLAIIIFLMTFLKVENFSPLPLLPLVHAPPNRIVAEVSTRLGEILRKLTVGTDKSWEIVHGFLGLTIDATFNADPR